VLNHDVESTKENTLSLTPEDKILDACLSRIAISFIHHNENIKTIHKDWKY
jgi:hypothetical protein